MAVLFYGTAIYNAPHAGSLKLDGGMLSCFCKFDYSDLEDEDEEVRTDKNLGKGVELSEEELCVTNATPSATCFARHTPFARHHPQSQPLVPVNDAAAAPYQSPYQSPFMTPNTLAKRRAAEKDGKVFSKVSRGGSFA
jgi:hypothetical protein